MQYIFSPDMKFRTWRKLWIALAETEKELGLNITPVSYTHLDKLKDNSRIQAEEELEGVYLYLCLLYTSRCV